MPTILLVDDEPDILAVLQMALMWRGYRVLLSKDGKAALDAAGRSLPDLIVTDYNMPQMDGIELCRQLKRYPVLAEIPVIMVSAQAPAHQKTALWNVFFFKPLDLDAFESTVGLLLLSRPLRETLGPVCSDRAISRWQPVPSAFIA
jgi:CheY-like chemotaxis protein